jgi:hypothetical protein
VERSFVSSSSFVISDDAANARFVSSSSFVISDDAANALENSK